LMEIPGLTATNDGWVLCGARHDVNPFHPEFLAA
jgi:hypothetical protein